MTKRQLNTLLKTKVGDKYSLNLRNFLRYRLRRFNDAHKLQVVKDNEDVLYIGIRMRRPDTSFIGIRLCVVMCQGGRARFSTYVATRGWKTIKNFWPLYIEQGICLLDPKHNHYTHRWTYNRDVNRRTCKFCGMKEKLVKTRRTVIDERWVKI